MKSYILKSTVALFILGLFFCSDATAQSFTKVAAAIKAGNASSLAEHFSGNVEITLKGSEVNYSKSQAEMVLKSFFNSHKPKSFTIEHEGSSPEGAKYFIGKLITENGNFRTYVFAKPHGNSLLVQEIRFEQK